MTQRVRLSRPRQAWTDSFDRPDSLTLGNGWVDGHDLRPDYYDRVGIHDGAAVLSAHVRDVDYEPVDQIAHPPAGGRAYCGISFAGRYCPDGWLPDIEVIRSGRAWMNPGPSVPYGNSVHVETTPLLYIDTDSPHGGFGCWASGWYEGVAEPWGWGIWATVGSPPELFAMPGTPVIAHSTYNQQSNRGPMSWRIKCITPDSAILIINDRQVEASTYGYDPVPIPAALGRSNLHGFAVDAHLTRPYALQHTTPAVLQAVYHGLGSEDFEIP